MATALEPVKPGGSPLQEDEPTITFRAQDKYAPTLLKIYAALCTGDRDDILAAQVKLDEFGGSPPEHVQAVRDHEARFRAWQEQHPDRVKIPD